MDGFSIIHILSKPMSKSYNLQHNKCPGNLSIFFVRNGDHCGVKDVVGSEQSGLQDGWRNFIHPAIFLLNYCIIAKYCNKSKQTLLDVFLQGVVYKHHIKLACRHIKLPVGLDVFIDKNLNICKQVHFVKKMRKMRGKGMLQDFPAHMPTYSRACQK